MIQVVDYENKNLGRIKNYDEKFLNTIKEKKLIDVFDDPELCERLERDYWTLRLAKQTAMDMIAYGRAGVGNMDAVVMLEPDQQLEVMKLACDFFVRNEIRTSNSFKTLTITGTGQIQIVGRG